MIIYMSDKNDRNDRNDRNDYWNWNLGKCIYTFQAGRGWRWRVSININMNRRRFIVWGDFVRPLLTWKATLESAEQKTCRAHQNGLLKLNFRDFNLNFYRLATDVRIFAVYIYDCVRTRPERTLIFCTYIHQHIHNTNCITYTRLEHIVVATNICNYVHDINDVPSIQTHWLHWQLFVHWLHWLHTHISCVWASSWT